LPITAGLVTGPSVNPTFLQTAGLMCIVMVVVHRSAYTTRDPIAKIVAPAFAGEFVWGALPLILGLIVHTLM